MTVVLHEAGRLRMTRGDYGVPLTLHVIEHCEDCGENLEKNDVFRAEILQARKVLFSQETSYGELEEDDGLMELYLTPEEAAAIAEGIYAFRVILLREGVVRNTLLATVLEVIP